MYISIFITCSKSYCLCDTLTDPWNVCVCMCVTSMRHKKSWPPTQHPNASERYQKQGSKKDIVRCKILYKSQWETTQNISRGSQRPKRQKIPQYSPQTAGGTELNFWWHPMATTCQGQVHYTHNTPNCHNKTHCHSSQELRSGLRTWTKCHHCC